ncbi:transcription regulator [Secundilactobacillus oryzae JCM 18671]|uniref:Transcription regulator n=1 Tax=Secundilactobacillus oryzae JCM 18671 TaxID=1291743 RepID=A0A081BG60_9LACO|nr:Crp/Fnr family transcriptional regulator [Secundilactobacillus oryzae]GAK47028.1 transcription regulator [Secundilactobacillus oryzae JCM 18671]
MHMDDSFEERKRCVKLVPIFQGLDEEQTGQVAELIEMKTAEKGEFLYRAGESSGTLYIIHHGQVRMTRVGESGKEQLLKVVTTGEVIGEHQLFSVSVHESFAETVVPTHYCAIKHQDMIDLLSQYPSTAIALLAEMSKRLEDSERRSASLTTESAAERLANYLLEAEGQNGEYFELPLTKKDLASYLGITPESLSRKLREFEAENLIKQSGRRNIKILDHDELSFQE